MNSIHGSKPPLHTRYDASKAETHLRNRYQTAHDHISKQVSALQSCEEFRALCKGLYGRGYPDWVITSVILNRMMNQWMYEKRLQITEKTIRSNWNVMLTNLEDVVYPCEYFLGESFDDNLRMFFSTVLLTWGFQYRRSVFDNDVVEKFLRERMLFFDHDLPHKRLFDDPPGDWPDLES